MNWLALPWLELAVVVPLLGAAWVLFLPNPRAAWKACLVCTALTLACTLLAGVAFTVLGPADGWLYLDELSVPLLILVALLHLLTTLATTRTKMSRFSFGGLLVAEALRMATFACREPWLLVALLCLGTVPLGSELRARGKPVRVYVLHMAVFVALLVSGQALVSMAGFTAVGAVVLLLAVLVRCGTVPAHCWVVDLFEHASFSGALLLVLPLPGVYAAMRLVLPSASEGVLQAIGIVSLTTAVYAAGMALVQREARRFFAYLFLSSSSLVLVGLELHTPISLTGALCLWISATLALGGLGMTLRALEGRFGRLALADYHGLYEHSPTLAAGFLLTGLACVGFPGTLGFIATELLVDGAIESNVAVGVGVVLATLLNGTAILRAYFVLFTGRRVEAGVSLEVTPRERVVILTLALLLLGGGIAPQFGVASRYRAACAAIPPATPGKVAPHRE